MKSQFRFGDLITPIVTMLEGQADRRPVNLVQICPAMRATFQLNFWSNNELDERNCNRGKKHNQNDPSLHLANFFLLLILISSKKGLRLRLRLGLGQGMPPRSCPSRSAA